MNYNIQCVYYPAQEGSQGIVLDPNRNQHILDYIDQFPHSSNEYHSFLDLHTRVERVFWNTKPFDNTLPDNAGIRLLNRTYQLKPQFIHYKFPRHDFFEGYIFSHDTTGIGSFTYRNGSKLTGIWIDGRPQGICFYEYQKLAPYHSPKKPLPPLPTFPQ